MSTEDLENAREAGAAAERRAQLRRESDRNADSIPQRVTVLETVVDTKLDDLNEKMFAHLGELRRMNVRLDGFVVKREFDVHLEWAERSERAVYAKLDPLYQASLREEGKAEALAAQRASDQLSAKRWQFTLTTAIALLGVMVALLAIFKH